MGNGADLHVVTLDSFCLDLKEATTSDYQGCVSATACSVPATAPSTCNWGVIGKSAHPINCVDWAQATAYCAWAGKALPTEAQWEYAARHGTDDWQYPLAGGTAPTVSPDPPNTCWCQPSSGTCPEASLPVDSYGLYDMAGNVMEWVQDGYTTPLAAATNPCINCSPGASTDRVTRGGTWYGCQAVYVMGYTRSHYTDSTRSHALGFRCAAKP